MSIDSSKISMKACFQHPDAFCNWFFDARQGFQAQGEWKVSRWLQCASLRFRWHWSRPYRDGILRYLSEGENNEG